LLADGIDVNGRNNYGETALHYAAFVGSVAVLAALIENKATLDPKNMV
jgi:ankyrin repeat protein